MKKYAFLVFLLSLLALGKEARAADAADPSTASPATDSAATAAPAAPDAPSVAPEAAPADAAASTPAEQPADATAPAALPAATPETDANENLEFVSGEISAVDEASKTLSVKLYGETENSATNKVLSVTTDGSTDITDGEKDRDLKSLTAGTEVDVEYDPASNKATYIFVY